MPHAPSPAARAPHRLSLRRGERRRLLGGLVDFVKPAEVFHFAEGCVRAGRKAIVANHNLHSLYLLRREPEVRGFYDMADLIEVDSVPLVLWARLLGWNSRRFHRCTYLDWRDEFWTWAQRDKLRVFFVGGAAGVAERAAETIRQTWPDVQLGVQDGYFDARPDSAGNQGVLAAIGTFAPDILLVGMGMPRQEVWTRQNFDALPPCVVFTVGGAFDYEAGVQVTCPRWIGRIGAEWLFRLTLNPKRLFSRYLIEPWWLIGPALGDVARAIRRRSRPQLQDPAVAIKRSR
jgi:N-acetylglucosaminyldiphosphoundecaprenol N-acetyl-beta-D-mannosaminyltransferase